ncbi:MAG: NAD(P)/FAD-dependent oxidoreductase [Planctomycetes bacterium]|nr:NAD(P)/FAD-dependent oxidoreductase [Planctomycetota bacterium]
MVIIGGGFGGLAAVNALAGRGVRITLIDRRNHHVFQPLLYQVATAALSPAQIAAPIRRIVRGVPDAEVLLAEATAIDAPNKRVILKDGAVDYDYLILAAGATHSYFGNDNWAAFAPGLKSIEDALAIRSRFLLAFERAERENDAAARRAELTFVVVGAGPTGVEIAGAICEIARHAIPRDFDRIDTATARVILVEAQDRVLPGFDPALSARALHDLKQLGVEVRLRTRVTGMDSNGIDAVDEQGVALRIDARNAVWGAGVRASPLGASLGVELDRAGRVVVGPDLTAPGHPEVFVIGDLAHAKDPARGMVPGMCPGAIQMGRYAARTIVAEVSGGTSPRPPFRYKHKGDLATIGRNRAVAAVFGAKFGGFFAWLLWAVVHVMALISFRSRVMVMLDWIWSYMFFERGARLITGDRPDAAPADAAKL